MSMECRRLTGPSLEPNSQNARRKLWVRVLPTGDWHGGWWDRTRRFTSGGIWVCAAGVPFQWGGTFKLKVGTPLAQVQ